MTESQKDNKILFLLFVFQCAQHVLSEWDKNLDSCYFGIGNMRLKDVRLRVNTHVDRYSKLAEKRGLKFPH